MYTVNASGLDTGMQDMSSVFPSAGLILHPDVSAMPSSHQVTLLLMTLAIVQIQGLELSKFILFFTPSGVKSGINVDGFNPCNYGCNTKRKKVDNSWLKYLRGICPLNVMAAILGYYAVKCACHSVS